MNPEAQRIAIAEACGWTSSPNQGSLGGWIARDPHGNHGYDAVGCDRENALLRMCPDYLNDLNAMHEAIMSVIVRGKDILEFESNEQLFREQLRILENELQVPCWHFEANQYAEAFLRTIGKWEQTS